MIYQSNNTLMRPFERKDLSETYRNWFHDSSVCKWNSHSLFPYTKKQMERFIENIEGDGPDIIWAIFTIDKYKNEQKHIGNCSLQSINWINRSAEIAFVMGDVAEWGKGHATEAGTFMLHHAFERLNLHRVWTGTVDDNQGMRRVAEKIGMQQEGIFREGVYVQGAFHNVIMYSILKGEYM